MFVGMIVFCIARFSICSPKYRLWVCISCSLTVQVPELSFVRSRHGSVQAPQGNCCMAEGVGVLFQGVPRGCGAEQQLAVHLRRFEAAFLPCTTACAECHLPCTAVGIIQCMHMAPTTNAMPSVTSASTSCTVMNGMHVMAKLVTAASTCVRSSHMHAGSRAHWPEKQRTATAPAQRCGATLETATASVGIIFAGRSVTCLAVRSDALLPGEGPMTGTTAASTAAQRYVYHLVSPLT